MITTEQKTKILVAINGDRERFPSDAKHAQALGISGSVYSMLKNGQTDKALSDANWWSIARKLNVNLRDEEPWKIAKTETFKYVSTQLEFCQQNGLSAILCDLPNIGKTFTAKWYVQNHVNCVYIDCSQVKTKSRLIRKIAKEFGAASKGTYHEVYEDLVYYLRSIDKPLVVLDEAGDLKYDAFLELKALWNATEHCCGWYMMGADGLQKKIELGTEYRKVGYAEMFSRYGGKFSKVTPDDEKQRLRFLISQATLVAKVNVDADIDAAAIARKCEGGLRRVFTEIEKLKKAK